MRKPAYFTGTVTLRCALFSFLFSVLSLPAFTQSGANPPFPRTAILQWGGGTTDWLSRFDLVITVNRDSQIVRSVRTLHPEITFLATTDWNAGIPFKTTDPNFIPPEWRVRTPSGSYVMSYSGYYLADISNLCGVFNGERYNQALARILFEKTDWSAFDGVNSDGTWSFPWSASRSGGIDLDRNGLDDYTEPGKGETWVRRQWQEGYNSMMSMLRGHFQAKWGDPDEKLITYWSITDTMCVTMANGVGWENAPTQGPSISSWLSLADQWTAAGPFPRVNYVCAAVRYDSVHAPVRKKDYFRFMRWMLGVTLLTDSYFMMDDEEGHHWYNYYYDEFDAVLGYPGGAAQKLSNGCSVRFFDNGVVIVNTTNSVQTVNDGDLAQQNGYNGPYYRFRGNQDTTWNTGEAFTSVTLKSTPASWPGNTQNVGDAIILLKTPATVVSDIIVDNAYAATSPGSPEASLTNFVWDQQANGNRANPLWSTGPYLDVSSRPEYWRSQYAPPGDGSAIAVFRPAINTAGRYQVYEWHGWRGANSGSFDEATNVPCRIAHDGGADDLTINQRTNAGQWNLLGTYTFRPGGNASVTINNRANGYVIADAFRFVYTGPDSSQMGGAIRGESFFDLNNNGTSDADEPGMSGWTVRLSGPESRTVMTTYDGSFLFGDLTPGTYTVTQDPRPGWTQTLPASGSTATFTVENGKIISGCEFGNYTPSYVEITAHKGWSLVSIPVMADKISMATVFPLASSDAYRYSTVYFPAEYLDHGEGYWVKFPESHPVWIPGDPVSIDTTVLEKGWNLAGSVARTISVDNIRTVPEGILASPFFGYSSGTNQADSLVPGEGYWIYASGPGLLIMGDNTVLKHPVFTNEPASMNSISFVTKTNNEQTLYFASGNHRRTGGSYSLPPIPPAGAFDVRFISGSETGDARYAVFYETPSESVAEFPIRLQSDSSPVNISWKINERDARFEIVDPDGTVSDLDGNEGEISVQTERPGAGGGSSIVLRVLPTLSTPVPRTFQLGQNFPNPFNSTTTLGFSLASPGWVRLTVYNMLGEKVLTLSDAQFDAGYHQIPVEAANWPSGVYLYRIIVDTPSGQTYSDAKSMSLLK